MTREEGLETLEQWLNSDEWKWANEWLPDYYGYADDEDIANLLMALMRAGAIDHTEEQYDLVERLLYGNWDE